MQLPPQPRNSMYRWLAKLGILQYPFKSIFNEQLYMTGISSQQLACGPFRSPKRAKMFQTWIFCRYFLFWPAKALQLGAVAAVWPAKVPQSGVDLTNLAVTAWSLVWTVGTIEFENLFLLCNILAWNGRCGVAIRKHWKSGTFTRRSSTLPKYR